MLEEEKIVKRARRGEAEAFGFLYDQYLPQIYRFVFLKTSYRPIAEDLTQQVFLHAWQNIGSYKHRGFPFSSWLYQIARNLVIDHYRTNKPQVELERAEDIPEPFNLALDVEKKFNLELVQQKIKELPSEYQNVIIMRFVEELAPKEIAEALGKSEGAVKVIQHRAINQLKKLINQNGGNTQKTKIA